MTFDRFRETLAGMNGSVLALDQRKAGVISAIVADLTAGKDVADSTLRGLTTAKMQNAAQNDRGIQLVPAAGGGGKGLAILRCAGIATYGFEFQPYCFSTRLLADRVDEAAENASIGAIALIINSPGGQVTGTVEAATAVFRARGRKPVTGIVDPLAASAAYWIAAQCTSLVGMRSSDVGSIGVYILHVESSRLLRDVGITPTFISAGPNKTEGNSLEPLSASAKVFLQKEVDDTYLQFLASVARGRGVGIDVVRASWGGGRVLGTREALQLGMIDRIESSPSAALRSAATSKNARTAMADYYRARLALLGAS